MIQHLGREHNPNSYSSYIYIYIYYHFYFVPLGNVFRESHHGTVLYILGPGPFGLGPIWAQAHLGPGPFGPRPIWAQAHMGPGPFGPAPIWARAHLGPGPFGPEPIWAGTHFHSFSSFSENSSVRCPGTRNIQTQRIHQLVSWYTKHSKNSSISLHILPMELAK